MINRRDFLAGGSAAAAALLFPQPESRTPEWRAIRLVVRDRASDVERAAIEDAAALLRRAIDAPIPILTETRPWGPADIFIGVGDTRWTASSPAFSGDAAAGSYRIDGSPSPDGPRVAIAGVDSEGARNGLYAFLERCGFAFFRDGEVVPILRGPATLEMAPVNEQPAFRWRGDMIWDNYLGPRRYCAAVWDDADWERALLFMARNRLNFLEFYPPMERVLMGAFPDAKGLSDGPVWKSDFKHAMARRILARGRALGIHFMYVLNYGFFPEPIRALYPKLEWANGHLCAHQPELALMVEKTWRTLIDEFGSDHLYAIRHRGEEGQSYSDPCRSITKAAGFSQAIGALKRIDADATMTVWTWGEKLPDLFMELPPEIRAAHIRHGMAGVFGDRGEGREQTDGAPTLPIGRRWLSGQFTVFGGNETLAQTPWNDVDALARDARADRLSEGCEGYFQWPEWSGTSPWTSSAMARIAWSPDGFPAREAALVTYAKARHGSEAEAFLKGFLPLVHAGNARITSTPRKRLLVPYFLTPSELALLEDVRAGARALSEALVRAQSPLLDRDFVDLCAWAGVRQAHVFEAASYVAHLERNNTRANDMIARAEITWRALRDLLAEVPELSIIDAARAAARTGPLSEHVIDSFWINACDFYGGYPLMLSPEAIELVYLDQLRALRARLEDAARRDTLAALDRPGWFWHDFPDKTWANTVRKVPSEDAEAFEREMKARLQTATQDTASNQTTRTGPVVPSEPSHLRPQAALRFVTACLEMALPGPLTTPPGNLPEASR